MTVFDFNRVLHLCHSFRLITWRGMAHESPAPHRLCSTPRLLAQARIQQVHSTLPGRSTTTQILLPRSVPLHGLCPTHVSRQLARYRNCLDAMSANLYHAGFRGKVSRNTLADANERRDCLHLQRLRSCPHCSCTAALCQRCLRRRSGSAGLCLRFDDHRSLPVAVPVGQIPQTQRSGQAAHLDRSARQYSLVLSTSRTAKSNDIEALDVVGSRKKRLRST